MIEESIAIYVDADACPVKGEIYRVAERHHLPVTLVSNSGMLVPQNPLFRQVIVGAEMDAADNWIADRASPMSIVVTADILLAQRCVEKGAATLGPDGRAFTPETIGMTVAMRNLMRDLREGGEISGYNPAFRKADRSNFLQALEQAVQALKRR
jgi:uncharacterized protein YaiI (UPF0178 family)